MIVSSASSVWLHSMSDKETKRTKQRGSSPIMRAFRENETVLRKFLSRFSSNFHDIEDITQETILQALKAEKTTQIEQPRAFLFGVARNVARKDLTKKSKSIVDFVEGFADKAHICNEPMPEEIFESRQRMLVFAEAVATLPAQCQKVFVLKKVYGYSHREIAKQLGISISTTEKHVAAGLKRCGDFMDRRMREEEDKIMRAQKR